MKILVTGAGGQLGREMQRVAGNMPSHTFIYTDVTDEFQKLDITNEAETLAFVEKENVEVIVNCAAYTNVDKAESDEAAANLINNVGPRNLALAAQQCNATLIHISTDYVFQGNGNTPCVETEPANPLGVYGRTKWAGEQSIATTGCKHIIIRTAWLYSKHGKNFLKTMMQLTRERSELKVVFDQVGTPTYAGDLAEAIAYIIATNQHSRQGIYHYSNEGVCSWYDFAVAINNAWQQLPHSALPQRRISLAREAPSLQRARQNEAEAHLWAESALLAHLHAALHRRNRGHSIIE